MKFLKYRNDFINQQTDLNEQINSSNLINEFLQNDIRFGDSYFGRLVNSSIQILKTTYKTARIPFVLKDLENNLQVMVDRIMFEQITKEYPTLFLKASLEEIKVCCMSTLTDEEKLNILIGWDGSFITYDPKDAIADIPGFYENRKIVNSSSLVQNKLDELNEIKDKLERALGPEIVKTYLDTLSDFIDELRKYAYEMSHPNVPTPSSTTLTGFNLNLLDVLKKVVKTNLIPENVQSFKLFAYTEFLNENQTTDNLSELKNISSQIITKLVNNPEEEVENSAEYKKLVDIFSNLTDAEVEVLKKKELLKGLEDVTKTTVVENEPKVEPTIPQTTSDVPSANKPQQKIEPTEPKTDDNSIGSEVKGTPEKEIQQKPSEPQETEKIEAQKDKVDAQSEESGNEIEGEPKESKNEKFNSKYFDYIHLMLEATPIPTSPSTTSVTGASTTTSTSTPTPTQTKDIEKIWNDFYEEVDKVFPAKMTQDDINKLKSFTPEKIDLAYDIVKKPDPLLKIVRIFELANSIYTTPVIPSGRENGEVWPLTYRRYSYVGTGSPGGPKSPGVGPWVHNPLFKQWKKGVMTMMSKSEFKGIFKDISNLIEKFEKDYTNFDKVFEQDKFTVSKEKSLSTKILSEFFLDILKLKNQGDFDVYASKAINKFFGINVDPSKLKSDNNKKVEDLPIDDKDIQPNTFVWDPFKQTKFDRTNENQYFAFPIQDMRTKSKTNYQIIFIRPLKIEKDLVEVKFTFDTQGEADLVQNSIGTKGFVKSDWSCDKSSQKNIYYGIMKNDFRNGIQICYANVDDSIRSSFKADPLYGEPSSKGGVIFTFSNQKVNLNSGKSIQLYNSKLIYFDNDKKKVDVKVNLTTPYNNENSNDKLRSLNTASGSKLYDELLKKGKDNFGWS